MAFAGGPSAVLNIVVTANSSQAMASLAKTQGALKATQATAQSTTSRTSQAMSRLGTVAKGAAIGFGVVGAASVKMAMDFEDSMEKVKNLVGVSQGQIDQWSDDLLKLAPKVGKSPKELADALYFVSSSGIKTSKVLNTVKVSAQASALGLGDAAVVADALTSAMNAYADSNLSARDATNVLIKTVREGKLESDELAGSIGRVLPIASKLGVSFQDVGASLASMSLQGLDAAEATTALRGIFSATFKPTADANDALRSVGLSAEELRKSLKEKGTLATLEMLSAKFDGNVESMAKVFPNIRALVGAFNLVGDNAERNAKITEELNKQTDDLGRKWEDFSKTPAQQMRAAVAGVQAAMVELGQKILPPLATAVTDVMDVLQGKGTSEEKFTKLLDMFSDAVQKNLPIIAKAGGAIGLALIKGIWNAFWNSDLLGKLFIAGTFIRLIGGPGALASVGAAIAKPIIMRMAAVFASTAVGTSFVNAFAVMAPMMGPVGVAIGVAIAGAAAAYIGANLGDNLANLVGVDDIVEDFSKNMDITIDEAQAVVDFMKAHPGLGADEALARMNRAAEHTSWVWGNTIDNIKGDTRSGVDVIGSQIGQGNEYMKAMAATAKYVAKAFDTNFQIMKQAVKTSVDGVVDSFGKGIHAAKQFEVSVSASVSSVATAVRLGFKNIETNTNKALLAFGVDRLSFGLATAVGKGAEQKKQRGGVIHALTGRMVPGSGSGDKVPAMLEPGEVVINRKAVAALGGARRANSINDLIPRFAKGGEVKGGVGAMVALANAFDRANEPYSMGGGHGSFLTSPAAVDCSGAVSAILHAGGLLQGAPMDTVALANWGKPATGHEPLVVATRPISGAGGHTVMKINGKVFGTSSEEPGGGAGWLSSSNPRDYVSGAVLRTMGVAGGVAAKIARQVLKGPDGPLKDLGQAALDRVRGAANKFIASKIPRGTAGGGDAGALGVKGGFDKVWGTVNPDLDKWARLMKEIVSVESSFDPHAGGPGTSNPTHAGWYQYDSPTWAGDAPRGAPGWPAGPYDPAMASAGAGNAIRSDGMAGVIQRWTTWDGVSPHLQKGGIVGRALKLAAGGRARRGGFGVNADFGSLQDWNFGTGIGANVARFPIDVNDPAGAGAAYQAALAAGVKPIMQGATWGNGPATPAGYGAQMAQMARDYPRSIFGLWNEPNLGSGAATGQAAAGGMSPSKAARFAVAGARGVRSVLPRARIIGPSVAPVGNWERYFRQMYRKVPKGLMEVGLNLYPTSQNRVAEVVESFKMARKFGPVDVTELDMAAPWIGGGDTGRETPKAIRALKRLGAKMVLLNSTAYDRYVQHLAGGTKGSRGVTPSGYISQGGLAPPDWAAMITATHGTGEPFKTIKWLAQIAKDLGGHGAGKIGHAEVMSAFSWSPAGTELSDIERGEQVSYWQSLIDVLGKTKGLLPGAIHKAGRAGNKPLQKAMRAMLRTINDPLAGEGSLLAAKQGLDELTISATLPDNRDEIISLLQQSLMEANLRTAVSQAQYGAFGGSPLGAQQGITVQSNPSVNVNVGSGMAWLRDFIKVEVDANNRTAARSSGTPGARLAGM